MKCLKSKMPTVPIATIALFILFASVPVICDAQTDRKFTFSTASADAGPPITVKEWEDRSDETFDKLNSGSQTTTWLIVGGLGLTATALILHYSNKKKEAKLEQQAEEEVPNSERKVSITPFMGFHQNPMEMRSDHKSLSDNLVVGVSVNF